VCVCERERESARERVTVSLSFLFIQGLVNAGNVGAVGRTCEAFGVQRMHIVQRRSVASASEKSKKDYQADVGAASWLVAWPRSSSLTRPLSASASQREILKLCVYVCVCVCLCLSSRLFVSPSLSVTFRGFCDSLCPGYPQ
jgi:hypothetical protein